MQKKNFLGYWKEFGGICGTKGQSLLSKGFIMYKIFILGLIALTLLWHLPNIIIGLFTSPLQVIAGFIVIGIMVRSIVKGKG